MNIFCFKKICIINLDAQQISFRNDFKIFEKVGNHILPWDCDIGQMHVFGHFPQSPLVFPEGREQVCSPVKTICVKKEDMKKCLGEKKLVKQSCAEVSG